MTERATDFAGYFRTWGAEWSAPLGKFQAIFDNDTVEVLSDSSPARVGVTLSQPVITCRSADLQRLSIEESETLTDSSGVRWRVKLIAHDGTGMARVFLGA